MDSPNGTAVAPTSPVTPTSKGAQENAKLYDKAKMNEMKGDEKKLKNAIKESQRAVKAEQKATKEENKAKKALVKATAKEFKLNKKLAEAKSKHDKALVDLEKVKAKTELKSEYHLKQASMRDEKMANVDKLRAPLIS